MTPRSLLVSVFALLCLSRAGAIPIYPGLAEMPVSSIPSAPAKVTIDGKLDEWRSIAGFDFTPFSSLMKAGDDPAMAALMADPISVSYKMCYDPDALYLGVAWHDRKAGTNTTAPGDGDHWSDGGEGFQINIRTDRVLHLACWPTPDGKVAMAARYDDQAAWQDILQKVTAAGTVAADGNTSAQEVRIPWSVITATGKLPGDDKLEMGVDFAWNAVPPSFAENVRKCIMANYDAAAPGIWASFLTAKPEAVTAGYIPNPNDWGTLNLGATPGGDQAVKSANGSTSFASLAVPQAQSPPATDGSLTGWDPASFQTASLMGGLWGQRFSGKLAAQYDADNLYLCVHFATPGPTNVKPEVSQGGFRGGDALQIRLTDGKKKIALCGWYDDSTGQPALTADGKDLPSPFLLKQGAKEAFKSDGQGGYVQTLAVPWSALFGSAPQPGQVLKATFQLWYADLDNRFAFHLVPTLQQMTALSVAYKMPADGELTLGLFDQDGQLLRWLAQGDFRNAGNNKEPWDGLDQYGNPVPAGNYRLKAIYHPILTADYKMSVCNPGNPPWPTPDDKGDWLGDEHDPQATATDGKWVYLAAPGSELGYSIIAVDENGQRQWGIRSNADGRSVSLAVSGNYLYALYSGCELTDSTRDFRGTNGIGRAILACYDKRTGQPVLFTVKNPTLHIVTWPYRNEYTYLDVLRNNKSFTPQVYGGQPRYFCNDIGETTDALGLAVLGGKVYVAMNYDNKLMVVDGTTGAPTGEEIPLDSPVGLCPLDDHTLLAVSGKQVVKVDVNSKPVTPVITSNLVAPDNITIDKDGNIYVSDWATSFQVKVFDSTGKFLRAIGQEGGRPWVGKWNANGMLVPRGVVVTDAGKVWVAEDDGSPKRISVWDSSTGALLKDYVGPTPYGGGTLFWIDPKDPTLVHTEGTTFKVDYAKKTYTPLAIDYRRENHDDPFTPIGHNLNVRQGRVLYHDGHEYVIDRDRVTRILERKGDVYRPVAAFGSVFTGFNNDGTEVVDWDSLMYRPYKGYFPDCFVGHAGYNYCWTDASGDNLVQPDEMQWVKAYHGLYKDGVLGPMGAGWGVDVGPDWSFYTMCQYSDHVAIVRVPLKGWASNGAPIYDLARGKAVAFLPPKHAGGSVHITDDEKIIVSLGFENIGLWTDSPDSIECFDMSGKKLWSIRQPKEMAGKEVHASGAIFDFKLPELGDVFGTWLYHGSKRPFLITTDGLYVGTLLDGTLLGPTSLRGESAVYYYQAPDGTPYIINGANQAEHIFQIGGLEGDNVGRFRGTYHLSDSDVKLAAAMNTTPMPQEAPQPLLAVAWLSKPPVIDGDLSGWNMGRGVSLDGGNGKTAEIALGRDADNLYLAYKVHEPTPPLRNGGTDWRSPFISGDCVDLMLQTDPKADAKRHEASAGDERLLFSVFQDKPVAVLYRPVDTRADSPSSLASAHFDQILQLDSAKVNITRDAAQGSYTVEAAVPLKDLNLDSKTAADLRGDVGVIFADETGKSRSLRLYYYNHHTEMIDDLATEATLQPDQWGKLTLPQPAMTSR